MFAIYLHESLILMALFLFGTLGEILTEKSGHLNLGIPGIMCSGGAGCMVALQMYCHIAGSAAATNGIVCVLLGIIGALIGGAIGGLIYSVFCVSLKANQNVVGLCLTTLGIGVYCLINTAIKDDPGTNLVTIARRDFIQLFSNETIASAGWFGTIFLKQGFMIWLSLILAFVMLFIMKKTNIGLSIKACGENPATADAVGINVTKVRYISTITGAAIAGLAGIVYTMIFSAGFPEIGLESFGWIAVALVIASFWNGGFAVLISLLFSLLYNLPSCFNIGGDSVFSELFKGLPYIITLVILIVTSVLKKRELQQPDGLGLNYFREDR